jgi:hypothetical protein
MADASQTESKNERRARYWERARLGLYFGLWAICTALFWAHGEEFGPAMFFGALPSLALDFVFALFSGVWGVGELIVWIGRRFRSKT